MNKEREIISSIVKYMTVELKNPEDVIISQNSKSQDMYYVAKGVCSVSVIDQTKTKRMVRHLLPGNHFGEIGMIYDTPRSATVISKNYCTLAKMSVEVYHDLTTEYPSLVNSLKEHIYTVYDDPLTVFCKEAIKKVPYFKDIGDEAIYDLLFTLSKRFCKKGEIIQNVGEDATTMYIVLNGMIELYTQFEKHNFILERLWRGSVMNYRTFFQEYEAQVCTRCITKTILLELTYEKMLVLTKTHEDMEKNFLKFENQILKEKKSYPLDYIMNLPEKYFGKANKEKYDEINRENIFKNVVMRRLYEIREIKSKPKLLHLIETKNISDWKARIEIKKKIRELKEKQTAGQFEDDISVKFNRLITNLERTLKILTAENIALNSVETKLIELSKKNIFKQNSSVKPPKSILNKSENKIKKSQRTTKIMAYERIEDEDYDSGIEEAKAERIKEISKYNYGIKNLVGGINITGEKKEEIEFSFSSESSNPN